MYDNWLTIDLGLWLIQHGGGPLLAAASGPPPSGRIRGYLGLHCSRTYRRLEGGALGAAYGSGGLLPCPMLGCPARVAGFDARDLTLELYGSWSGHGAPGDR
jgi:hypothetical protein